MMQPRKLVFQLTPLLDLLLIVIFAQYLEVETTAHQERRTLDESRRQVASELQSSRLKTAILESRITELELEASVAEAQLEERDRLLVQRHQLGTIVQHLFRIPESVLSNLMRQKNLAGPGSSTSDQSQLQSLLKDLGNGTPERVVEHLLTFGEMRKRMDIWELYISSTGQFFLSAGGQQIEFRVETPAELRLRLYDTYKTLPETKSMVLILLSYGDVRFETIQTFVDGMPETIDRIRLDVGNRARIEYAVLGFRSHWLAGPHNHP